MVNQISETLFFPHWSLVIVFTHSVHSFLFQRNYTGFDHHYLYNSIIQGSYHFEIILALNIEQFSSFKMASPFCMNTFYLKERMNVPFHFDQGMPNGSVPCHWVLTTRLFLLCSPMTVTAKSLLKCFLESQWAILLCPIDVICSRLIIAKHV